MNKEDEVVTKIIIVQGGITMTVELPDEANIDDLLSVFKQASVGLGFADYGEATFTKLEEIYNG